MSQMNILKKAIYVASSPKGERRDELEHRPVFTFKLDRTTATSRDADQDAKYYLNGKYSNNFLKVGSREKLTLNSTKQMSKKSLDRSSLVDNSNSQKKSILTAKIKILPQKNVQSNKQIQLREFGSSNSPSKDTKVSLNFGSSKHRVSQDSQFFPNDKQDKRQPLQNSNQMQPMILNTNNFSKLRIVSRDKTVNESKNFKISIGNQKDPIIIKRQGEKSPPKNPQKVELYLKMDKLVSAKSRSIDGKKKEAPKPNSMDKEKRPHFLSEDKDQTKYMMQERPIKYLGESNTVSLIQDRIQNSKNYYFQLLKKKLAENEEVNTVIKFIKNAFAEWQNDSLAEFFAFKTQIGFYKIRQKVGKGCFGKVYLATQILTGMQVALKVIPKTNIKNKDSRKKIEKEVAILKKINNHHAIIKLFEVFEDANFVYMVFEYLENGDLVQYFKKQPLLEEPELRVFFLKILKGIDYLHKNGIVHRDIKLDNILLDKHFQPKVCDFGISSIIEPNKRIFDTGGTPAYLAPEVIKAEGEVGPKSDVWSLGVLLYLLNFGIVPFKANDMQVLYNKIIIGSFKIPDQNFTSLELIDLIKKILVIEVEKRISIEEILRHPWLRNVKDGYPLGVDDSHMRNENIKEGIVLYLQYLGFPEGYVHQSIQKGLFNHIKACFDALGDKFKS